MYSCSFPCLSFSVRFFSTCVFEGGMKGGLVKMRLNISLLWEGWFVRPNHVHFERWVLSETKMTLMFDSSHFHRTRVMKEGPLEGEWMYVAIFRRFYWFLQVFEWQPGPNYIKLLKQKEKKWYMWHGSLTGNLVLISITLVCLACFSV